MRIKYFWIFLFFLSNSFLCFGQEKEPIEEIVVVEGQTIDTIQQNQYSKSPLKASLYSAVLPGLGQVYNKKVWKVPVIWALLGTGLGFSIYLNNEHQRFREAFIAELNGEQHEFSEMNFSLERLADLQDDRRRNRDYAIVITSLIYILNILDATVDAHLFEFDHNPNLSVKPEVLQDGTTNNAYFGLNLSIDL